MFRSSLLLAGKVSVAQVRLQLSRWVAAGRLLRLRRGVYALAPPWRRVEPHPFVVANALHTGSYVSLQAALAYHGLIPEHVPVVTSVGPGRPEEVANPLGTFVHRHLAPGLLFGYTRMEVAPRQHAFVAEPEKALLDLVHLTPGGDAPAFLSELRLQNADVIDAERLAALARQSGRPRLARAAERVVPLLRAAGGSG
ncbi:MAG: hypothetical protein HYU66_19335 [Armatimonadetes bacterium]|nr:hypothetical protein [Armatimonadota bacterium]